MNHSTSRLLTPTGVVLSNPKAKRVKLAPREPNMRLREARENRGLSANELASKAQIPSGQTIRDAERGRRPRERNRIKIARVLEMKVTDIWPSETPKVLK